jgi:hypothetical protein
MEPQLNAPKFNNFFQFPAPEMGIMPERTLALLPLPSKALRNAHREETDPFFDFQGYSLSAQRVFLGSI